MTSKGAPKLLVVDDEEPIRTLIQGALKDENLTIECARNRAEGLSFISSQEFDVVIVDKQLPDGSGLDIIDAIQRRGHRTLTILITAYSDTDSAIQAVSLGVFRYIPKPFDIKSLKNDVAQALQIGQLRRDLANRTDELTKMNHALRDREARYRVLFNSGNDAILVFPLTDTGIPMPLIEVNDMACELFGYAREELFDMSITSLVSGPDGKEFTGLMSSLLLKKQLLFEMEAKTKSGKSVPVEISGRLFEFSGDGDLTVFAVVRDIAERRASEEERKHLEMQFRESQKMEAIGRLAGGVAHDMNNVLGAIMGFASALETETFNDEHWKNDVSGVLKACAKGRALTQDLLGFARKGKYVRENVAFNTLIDDVVNMLTRLASKKVTFITDIDAGLAQIEGDNGQLNHALMNVCLNAVDAIEEAGGRGTVRITSKTKFLDEKAVEQHEGLCAGRYVEIKIKDDGKGMDEETLAHACEPFYTTKPPGKGTGLGLSMVYGSIKNHFGSVHIDSEVGKGTTVTLYLPASEKENPRAIANSLAPPTVTNDAVNGTILLVDDEPMVRNSGKRLLGRLGYSVLLARDGEEAIELYRDQKDDIWLVVLDLIMPAMDGEEVFIKLREIDEDARVLLSSGYSKEEKAESLMDLGAAGFLQKPFDLKMLVHELNRIRQNTTDVTERATLS